MFNIQTADTICKTTWIPDRQYQVSSMRPPYSSASQLNLWHAIKPFVPQYNVEYASLPIEDYEWFDTNHCIILVKKAVAIK